MTDLETARFRADDALRSVKSVAARTQRKFDQTSNAGRAILDLNTLEADIGRAREHLEACLQATRGAA